MKRALFLIMLLAVPMTAGQTPSQGELLSQARALANADYYAACPTIQQAVAIADARLQVPQDAASLQQLQSLLSFVATHKQLWSRFHELEQGPSVRAAGLELENIVAQVSLWMDNITLVNVPDHEALLKLAGDDLLTAISSEAARHQSQAIPAATRLAYLDVRLAVLQSQGRTPGALQGIRDDLAQSHAAQLARAAQWVERAEQQLATPVPGTLALLTAYPDTVDIQSHLASSITVLQDNGDLANAAEAQKTLSDFNDRARVEQQRLGLALFAVLAMAITVGIAFSRRTITWYHGQGEASIGDLIGGTK